MNEPIYCSIDPVVFCVHDKELFVLLYQRQSEPYKKSLALPGGLIQTSLDESVDDAVNRVLKQKTGLEINYKEQVFSLGGWRDPRNWTLSIAYMALVNYHNVGNNSTWLRVDDAMKQTLAFDHNLILSNCLQRLTNKVSYSTLPIYLMEKEFTLPDLQKIYEVLLKEKLDKSSFRKKIDETNLLEETGTMRQDGPFRPSKLYKLKKSNIALFQRNMI